jgi:hypothetical protein
MSMFWDGWPAEGLIKPPILGPWSGGLEPVNTLDPFLGVLVFLLGSAPRPIEKAPELARGDIKSLLSLDPVLRPKFSDYYVSIGGPLCLATDLLFGLPWSALCITNWASWYWFISFIPYSPPKSLCPGLAWDACRFFVLGCLLVINAPTSGLF